MAQFIRYVFFRLKAVRVRIDRDPDEAALTALLIMSLSPVALFVSGDMVAGYFLDVAPLFSVFGRWLYGLGLFSSVFLWHYVSLVRGDKVRKIDAEFAGARRGRKETCAVALYLIVPPALMFVIAGALAPPS